MSNDERRRLRAERARKRKRRKNILLAVFLTLLILIVGIVLSLTVFFHVSAVTVTGDEVYASEEIVNTSGISIGENMFLMNAKEASKSIERTLPYVEKAEIKRKLSGEIVINITAAKATAALESEGNYFLLSPKGKVLEENVLSINDDMILISGGEIKSATVGENIEFANADVLESFQTMLDILKEADLSGITKIDLEDKSNIKVSYDGRILLKLGMLQDIAGKMDFVKATLAKHDETTPNFRGEMDFTISNKAFIHAEDSTTLPATPKPAEDAETTKTAEEAA